MPLEVRDAEIDDGDAIARLLRQLGYEREPSAVASDIARGDAGDVIVAVLGGRLVGVLTLRIHRQLHRGGAVASIDSLVVDESTRSSGIGAALMEAAVQRAGSTNCLLVDLHSNQDRVRARRFYERLGFCVTSNYFERPLT